MGRAEGVELLSGVFSLVCTLLCAHSCFDDYISCVPSLFHLLDEPVEHCVA